MGYSEWLFSFLIALQVLDAWSTYRIIELGGRELNNALAWLMDRIGVLPALVVVKVAMLLFAALAVWFYGDDTYVQVILTVIVIDGLESWSRPVSYSGFAKQR